MFALGGVNYCFQPFFNSMNRSLNRLSEVSNTFETGTSRPVVKASMDIGMKSRKPLRIGDHTQTGAWQELCQHVNTYFTQTGNEVAVIGATYTHNEFFVEGSSLMKHAVSQNLLNIEDTLALDSHKSNGEQKTDEQMVDLKTKSDFDPNQAASVEEGLKSCVTNNHNITANGIQILPIKMEEVEVSQGSIASKMDLCLSTAEDAEPGLNMSVSYEETESNYKTEDSESPDEECAIKTEKGQYSCMYCHECFQTYNLCQVHLQSHTSSNTKFKHKKELKDNCKSGKKVPKFLIFDCKVCGQVCATKEQLKEHKAQHKVPKACFCTLCNQGFSNEQRLVIHKRTIHGNESKTHMCHICGLKFKTKRIVKEHVKRAHDRDHACDKCGKCFGSTTLLTAHSQTHAGSRPHICEICGKDFSKPIYLTVHMRSHTGEKPFSCQECGKSFTSITCLNRHLSIHTGVKPHACTFCDKKFRRLCDMKRHFQRHSGDKPFPCEYCDKQFADLKSRKRHIQVSCTIRNYIK